MSIDRQYQVYFHPPNTTIGAGTATGADWAANIPPLDFGDWRWIVEQVGSTLSLQCSRREEKNRSIAALQHEESDWDRLGMGRLVGLNNPAWDHAWQRAILQRAMEPFHQHRYSNAALAPVTSVEHIQVLTNFRLRLGVQH